MKPFVRPTSVVAVTLFTLLAGGAAQLGCNSGGGGGGGKSGKGGDAAGGSGEGGSSAGEGGSGEGGSGEATGGKKTGGAGGSKTGGTNAGGSGTGGATGGAGGGATGGAGGAVAGAGGVAPVGGVPAFCNDPKAYVSANQGEHNVAALMSSTSPNPNLNGPAGMMLPAGDGYDSAWVPTQYETAASGKVGLFVAFGEYNTTAIAAVVRKLVEARETPPIIVAHAQRNANRTDGATNATADYRRILAAFKASHPKLSDDPKWHVISGQSTTGAVVFQVAWDNPTLVAKVIAGSGSFVPFMPQYPYTTRINGSSGKNTVLSMIVGNCDIFPNCQQRPAYCGACDPTNGGQVDTSGSGSNWIAANRVVLGEFKKKNYPAHMLVVGTEANPKGHTQATWIANMMDQLRFVMRDITCGSF